MCFIQNFMSFSIDSTSDLVSFGIRAKLPSIFLLEKSLPSSLTNCPTSICITRPHIEKNRARSVIGSSVLSHKQTSQFAPQIGFTALDCSKLHTRILPLGVYILLCAPIPQSTHHSVFPPRAIPSVFYVESRAFTYARKTAKLDACQSQPTPAPVRRAPNPTQRVRVTYHAMQAASRVVSDSEPCSISQPASTIL